MGNFQKEKELVKEFHKLLDRDDAASTRNAFKKFTSSELIWRGFYPFDEFRDSAEVVEGFWQPLKCSLNSMQRREDIFFAGGNYVDNFESVWVVSMGHLMGLFDQPWLGIAPTHKMAFLRYCEFHRIADGNIQETAMYFDIPHFMVQAGRDVFPKQTAVNLVQPGPRTHAGLLYGEQLGKEGSITLALINKMISDLGQWENDLPLEEELRLTWHDDMIWWGPTGIGSAYTIERYAKQHARPFRAAFSDRSGTGHIARLAEGNYGGFFGWPNFSARLTGDFMGYPATGKKAEFRVIDIYRRNGKKLAENWVFIDLLYFWKQQGIDVLASNDAHISKSTN